MSLQCQYAVCQHRVENPTKSRCCYDIAWPLGLYECETSLTSACMCCDNLTKNKEHKVCSLFDKFSHIFVLF